MCQGLIIIIIQVTFKYYSILLIPKYQIIFITRTFHTSLSSMQSKSYTKDKSSSPYRPTSKSPINKAPQKTFQTNHASYCHCSLCRNNQSDNPVSLSPKNIRNSNSKSRVKSQEQQSNEQSFSKLMKKNRQKLCNSLDAYILIMETNSPLRCLEHNSVLSLYCETQQKLLCANCVYRNQNHRLHKVQPIQQCYRMVARDIELMQRQTAREIQSITVAQEQINNVFKEQEKNASEIIIALAHQFEQIQSQLRKYFDEIKIKVIATIDKLCFKQENLLLQLGFYKDIFKHNTLPSKQQIQQANESHLIYYHLIGNTLMNNAKFSKSNLRISKDHVKQIEKVQLKKLEKIKSQITGWLKEKQAEKNNLSFPQTHPLSRQEINATSPRRFQK